MKNLEIWMEMRDIKMESPFVNDMFSMVYRAFKNLYPDKECECWWDVIDEKEGNKGAFGVTVFGDGGIHVIVDVRLRAADAVEVLGHELAHVAVGGNEEHGEEWEKAFYAIYEEYERVADEFFPGALKINPNGEEK